jgi:hypothetical protein
VAKGSARSPDVVPCSTAPASHISDRLLDATSTSSLEHSSVPQLLVSFQLQLPDHRRLLYHYDRIVAPNMAWAGTMLLTFVLPRRAALIRVFQLEDIISRAC